MTIGVVLVAYNSGPDLLACLDSLQRSEGAELRLLVVNNACTDDTPGLLRDWAAQGGTPLTEHDTQPRTVPAGTLEMWNLPVNLGFAGGVNAGLKVFRDMEDVDYIWILNPDSLVLPQTAAALEAKANTLDSFAVVGGRIVYADDPGIIQSDGGRVNFWTGICYPHHLMQKTAGTPMPDDSALDYISGAHMLVSKEFIAQAGLMPEEYFLYYEEADWCLRRGDLGLYLAHDAVIQHQAGGTIGSASHSRGPSPISAYFMARSRRMFIRRYRPLALPLAVAYSFAKAMKMFLKGQSAAGKASLRGLFNLPLTAEMQAKIGNGFSRR